ncbi:MAG: hypothetical protein ACREDV_04450, partial [Methylocella sp.]
ITAADLLNDRVVPFSEEVDVNYNLGYRGLAALIAVAWDTQLSPIDVRRLTSSQLRKDARGLVFVLARAKTGRAAMGTPQRRAEWVLDKYTSGLAGPA